MRKIPNECKSYLLITYVIFQNQTMDFSQERNVNYSI